MNLDYEKAKQFNLLFDRWAAGTEHHPESIRIIKFLQEIDLHEFNDYFQWSYGGDGDNGETLMFQLDAYFETLDKDK